MKPEQASRSLLGMTRSKAKMHEYDVPLEHHITITRNPAQLFTLTIGLLGDISAASSRGNGGEGIDSQNERQQNLIFAARFFDAYLQARFEPAIDAYLLLLASAAFYLCDLPGTSTILAKRIPAPLPDLEAEGLEKLLHWMLLGDFSVEGRRSDSELSAPLDVVRDLTVEFYANGESSDRLLKALALPREAAYTNGTPRQLLLADILTAVTHRRIHNSAWHSMPTYSGLPLSSWRTALTRERAIHELWPAQHLLGKKGVFEGKSAVVQMPTSAGKTRAIELVIRSSFLAGRTELVVIVAPFRALCHEISLALHEAFLGESVSIDEPTDSLQFDFDLEQLLASKQILVVTPEKLVYMVRHAPELAASIGLIIYDEGHQFDSGLRGVTYELLLSSLRSLIAKNAQSILVSAVITNGEAIGGWMHGPDTTVVSGTNLTPMYRTVAFASWLDHLGQLKFVKEAAPNEDDFFVPRVLSQHELNLRGRERKQRFFPEREDGQSIALYLGLRLAGQGSVAIFCGRKDTASRLCDKVVEAYSRGLQLATPLVHSNAAEVGRLAFLHNRHLGSGATATRSAALGIFSHHGNTTQGIRLALEYAMKKEMVRFVVCTSTLAQGVNLPIRYLVVTSVYQGAERIKVRDFHNLIGRAGRAGMHTEGTILFADPVVYDKRKSNADGWRWRQIQELLDPGNSEPVLSTLQTLFEPLRSDDEKFRIEMKPLDFVQRYMQGPDFLSKWIARIVRRHADKGFTNDGLYRQFEQRKEIIAAIESYLMTYWDEAVADSGEEYARSLAEGTLAYFLSDEEKKAQIIELFGLLARHVRAAVPDPKLRTIYGKTLQGLTAVIALKDWVDTNLTQLREQDTHEKLLDILWPILSASIKNRTFQKCDKPDALRKAAFGWLAGTSFCDLYAEMAEVGVKIMAGSQRRDFTIDHLVDLCESGFGYDGALLIGAAADLLSTEEDEANANLIVKLGELHKRFKYGVSTVSAVLLHECGFADREVCKDLALEIGGAARGRRQMLEALKEKEAAVLEILERFPSYFGVVLDNLYV